MVPCVFGSDNGKSGFLVFLTLDKKILHIEQYTTGVRLHELLNTFKPSYAVTEQVFMSANFAHVASTGFTILGRYLQSFELLDIKYEAVRAVTWRKLLNIKVKGRDNQKEAAIQMCKEVFSNNDCLLLQSQVSHIVDHHRQYETIYDNNKCESALIALYALKQYQNLI